MAKQIKSNVNAPIIAGVSLVTEREGKFEFPIAPVVSIVAAAIEQAAPIVIKTLSKADLARAVFADCYKDGAEKAPARKDIIARFMSECQLTKDGAATYLQNFKKVNGFVTSKAA